MTAQSPGAPRLKAVDVFTPGAFPKHTYVERDAAAMEQRLRDGLATPGQIVSISGPSKSGKTVLVEKVVGKEALIAVTGAGVKNPDQIWERVLDWLQVPSSVTSTDVRSRKTSATASAKGGAKLFGVGGEIGGSTGFESGGERGHSKTSGRGGLMHVVRELANTEYVLLIDDFHYMSRKVQKDVAKQLKEAVRQGVKICTASVRHRSDDVIRANPDLRGRVLSLDLEYWSEESLLQIAYLGFKKLGATLDKASIQRFATESAGSPQLMQSICLHACFDQDLRLATTDGIRQLNLNAAQAYKIFEATAAATDYRTLVDVLDSGPKKRGRERSLYKLADGDEGDVYTAILQAVASDPPRLSFEYDDILKRVASVCRGKEPPAGSSITAALEQMAKLAAENSPEQRAIDWDDSRTKPVLDIPDPYLLFYLRWSGHILRRG